MTRPDRSETLAFMLHRGFSQPVHFGVLTDEQLTAFQGVIRAAATLVRLVSLLGKIIITFFRERISFYEVCRRRTIDVIIKVRMLLSLVREVALRAYSSSHTQRAHET